MHFLQLIGIRYTCSISNLLSPNLPGFSICSLNVQFCGRLNLKILMRLCQIEFKSPILFPQDLKSNFDLLVGQTLVEVLHVNVTIQRYSLYAGMANTVEKGGVLAKRGTVERQIQILKSLRRNGALQAFKCF